MTKQEILGAVRIDFDKKHSAFIAESSKLLNVVIGLGSTPEAALQDYRKMLDVAWDDIEKGNVVGFEHYKTHKQNPFKIGEGYELYEGFPEKADTRESGIVFRFLNEVECPHFPSGFNIKAGTIIYRYFGPDWGSYSGDGFLICLKPEEYPFYEVPIDCVIWR
jgi:hypothetical protein